MITFPNAKINLGLYITEKREDGFHNLETVFYPIGLSDILEIQEQEKQEGCNFLNTGIPIDAKAEDNLCCKTYQALRKDFSLPGISLHLHKIIPFGAGLGGGSSDAAFTMHNLNHLFNLQLSTHQLEKYAESLGSDIPFFLYNKPLYAWEKGNKTCEINIDLTGYYLIVVVPPVHISTKVAYQGITPKKREVDLKEKIAQINPEEWKNHIFNDFEPHIFRKYPELEETKETLYRLNAVYASMSGSGSAIYGIFKEPPEIQGLFKNHFVWTGRL